MCFRKLKSVKKTTTTIFNGGLFFWSFLDIVLIYAHTDQSLMHDTAEKNKFIDS